MRTYLIIFLLLLFAFPAAADDVQATWDPVTLDEQGGQENISHYMLYWGSTSRGSVTRPTDPAFSYDEERNVGDTTSSQQSGFTPGQTYYFAVAAVDVSGNISAYSAEVVVTIPSDQDGGVDGGGEDAGVDAGVDAGADARADEAPADRPGADEEIVIEGTCGCSGGFSTDLWLVALLAVPFVRRKRE